MRRFPLRLALAAAAVLLASGCTSVRQSSDSFLGLITPYRIDIVQGNVVTREQAEQLRPGMSRLQVREIVGTPLVADLFHADRWDYIFTIRRPGTAPQRRSVVLLFDGETLKSVEAPDLPTEREFVASITRERKIEPRVLELTEAQRKALPAPPRAEAPAAGSASPPRDYPPLEAS